nr:unnamed protein product [Callosobruchus analis]
MPPHVPALHFDAALTAGGGGCLCLAASDATYADPTPSPRSSPSPQLTQSQGDSSEKNMDRVIKRIKNTIVSGEIDCTYRTIFSKRLDV